MLQTVRRSLLSFVVIGGCVGLATGCHKKPAETPAPVTAKAPVRPVEHLPAREPGLWQTTVSENGSEDTPQILQICIDAVADVHLGILGTDLSGDKCSQKTVSHMPDGSWGLLAECDMGSGVVNEYSGSISGDYTHDYSMKMRSQTTGGNLPQMNRVTNYVVTSKRLGVCTADQRPGDVVNDGVKVNLFDMSGMRPPVSAAAKAAPVAASTNDAKDVVD